MYKGNKGTHPSVRRKELRSASGREDGKRGLCVKTDVNVILLDYHITCMFITVLYILVDTV